MVLDTDVVVAALRSPTGASAALLLAALDRRVTLVASVPLVIEYEAVCGLAEHQQAAGVSAVDAQVFLDGLAVLIESVETHFLWRPRLRDPADEMVLEAAVNGRADVLVTFNLRDYGSIPLQFGIKVLRPNDALRSITP